MRSDRLSSLHVATSSADLIAAARPVSGTTADAYAWRASGLTKYCHGVTVLGDGAYVNYAMVTPHRKRPHRAPQAGEEANNTIHRKVPARGRSM
ncbi:hypothetical protein OOZ58_45205 [Streptomyces tauricus]|nr:hypothetical protein [Streptomyces tauricus]MCW8103633.1 hypothetical protein [Streptomyces tauricus]